MLPLAGGRFEQAWEARLFYRGYQYLLPRRGGGWTLPPFATDYNSRKSSGGSRSYGYETNIYTSCGEIVCAALNRDIPEVRFEPQNPMKNGDVTAAGGATKYARIFARNNDLFDLHQQLNYYLWNDSRAIIIADHVLDAQRFGRETPEQGGAVPEDEVQLSTPLGFVMRHGETSLNQENVERGRIPEPINQSGQEEVEKTAGFLKDKGIQRLVSSPVERAADSAEIVGQSLGVAPDYDPRFASLDLGDFAGQPKEQAHEQISHYAQNPTEKLPGSTEGFGDLDNRVQDGIMELLAPPEAGQPRSPFAVVTHNSVISSLNRALTGTDDHGADFIPPGGVAAIYEAPGGGYTFRPVYPQQPSGVTPMKRGRPRGMEIVEVVGKLEGKVPMNTQTIHDCSWVQVSREYDVSYAKAMFPAIADKIHTGGAGSGENELDRIARINAALALEASYVTGDSMVRDCTIQRTWIRPSYIFGECDSTDEALRDELMEAFPDGALVVYAGGEQAFARNEGMDDHVTIVHAYPGSGQNRMALGTKLLSLQKRLNNWVDLLDAFFRKTVPMTVMDNQAFDVTAISEQGNVPGGTIEMARQTNGQGGFLTPEQLVWVMPTPTHQPALPDFIKFFITDLPQLLSGAMDTLFGAESNTDTVGGLAIQRDQALARLANPWHSIQMATCSYFRQAVQLAAKCRKGPISSMLPGSGIINIELSDLKGNILTFPVEDSNFPESPMQVRALYQQLLTIAQTNPMVQTLLSSPKNMKFAKDTAGYSGLDVPGANEYDKQLGELELLLKSGPLPNPQKAQLQDMLASQKQEALADATAGIPVDPQQESLFSQIEQTLETLPDEISSVTIKDTDNHEIEARCLLDWFATPEGRQYANGTANEKAAYENVHLHWQEHDKLATQKKAQAAKEAMPVQPVRISGNIKDLPPKTAASAAAKAGLEATPQDFTQDDNAQTALEIAKKGA
jgi:broad specificity phosphatase PhoE